MSELQVFNNPEFGNIRTITEGGKTLFCGKDVATALGYSDPKKAIARHCKGGTKRPLPTNGGVQEIVFIPEGDIYRLAARSELPGAEKFERWIFDEVLPSIRKHGAYLTPEVTEKLDTLTLRVDQLANAMPAVTYCRPQPEVSLTGLAKVITITRRVMLDMGSSPDTVGEVTRSILNTCGFHLPDFKKRTSSFISLLDFF